MPEKYIIDIYYGGDDFYYELNQMIIKCLNLLNRIFSKLV